MIWRRRAAVGARGAAFIALRIDDLASKAQRPALARTKAQFFFREPS